MTNENPCGIPHKETCEEYNQSALKEYKRVLPKDHKPLTQEELFLLINDEASRALYALVDDNEEGLNKGTSPRRMSIIGAGMIAAGASALYISGYPKAEELALYLINKVLHTPPPTPTPK